MDEDDVSGVHCDVLSKTGGAIGNSVHKRGFHEWEGGEEGDRVPKVGNGLRECDIGRDACEWGNGEGLSGSGLDDLGGYGDRACEDVLCVANAEDGIRAQNMGTRTRAV